MAAAEDFFPFLTQEAVPVDPWQYLLSLLPPETAEILRGISASTRPASEGDMAAGRYFPYQRRLEYMAGGETSPLDILLHEGAHAYDYSTNPLKLLRGMVESFQDVPYLERESERRAYGANALRNPYATFPPADVTNWLGGGYLGFPEPHQLPDFLAQLADLSSFYPMPYAGPYQNDEW